MDFWNKLAEDYHRLYSWKETGGNDVRLYTYDWCVSNYNMIENFPNKFVIKSPTFNMSGYSESMTLYLVKGNNGIFRVGIVLCDQDVLEKADTCTEKSNEYIPYHLRQLNLAFLDSENKILYSIEQFNCNSGGDKHLKLYWRGVQNIIEIIENNMLRIQVKCSLCYHFSSFPLRDPFPRCIDNLSDDMRELTTKNLFSDMCIKFARKTVYAHKVIILPQFPLITKLNSNLKSEQDGSCLEKYPTYKNCKMRKVEDFNQDSDTVNEIYVPEEDSEVVMSILSYLYSGKFDVADKVDFFKVYEFARENQLHELSNHLAPEACIARSEPKTQMFKGTLHIKDYSHNSRNKNTILQRIATEQGSKYFQFRVNFDDSEKISVSLDRIGQFGYDMQIVIKLVVCCAVGFPLENRKFQHFFSSETPTLVNEILTYTFSPDVLFNDTVTLLWEITICKGKLESNTQQSYPEYLPKFQFFLSEGVLEEGRKRCAYNQRLYFGSWLKNLKHLFDTGDFSDISLFVQDTEFKVHKAILSARSSVFARMFETDMSEKFNRCVKIEDFSSTVMKSALLFIYTGKCDDVTIHESLELYRIADMYAILNLRDTCAWFIMRNIDADIACEVLILADLHNDKKLRRAARYAIRQRTAYALATPYGQELMSNKYELIQDLLGSPPLEDQNAQSELKLKRKF